MDSQNEIPENIETSRDSAPSFSVFSELKLRIEALLFSAETALDVAELRSHLGEVSLSEVRLALKELARDCEGRAFQLCEFGGKFQLRTREQYAELVRKQFMSKPKSLSKSALETLAIVAYRQPVTRAEVNIIRNVDSSSIMQSLKERDLIMVAGTRKELGSPLEFKTTPKFLEVFGLISLNELPSLRSLQMNADDRQDVAKALDTLDGVEEEIPSSQELSFPDEGAGASGTETKEIQNTGVEDAEIIEDVREIEGAQAAPVTEDDLLASAEVSILEEERPSLIEPPEETLEAQEQVEEAEEALLGAEPIIVAEQIPEPPLEEPPFVPVTESEQRAGAEAALEADEVASVEEVWDDELVTTDVAEEAVSSDSEDTPIEPEKID